MGADCYIFRNSVSLFFNSKSATVMVFTPQILANTTDQDSMLHPLEGPCTNCS